MDILIRSPTFEIKAGVADFISKKGQIIYEIQIKNNKDHILCFNGSVVVWSCSGKL